MIQDRRLYTVFALMLASFLTAVDVTIVDTAMPRIVGALGGFSLLTWLVTAYMLASTATVPVYGKLADLFGRKKIFTVGAAIFVGGSALCGMAQSMEQLILFRAVQGLGAGAVLPTVQTILGDIFSPAERAKYQAWFSAVWGFSGLSGPALGGLIVDHASWRWLFYINLPLGILAVFMVWRFLEEKLEPRKVQIDYLGAISMTAGITCLLLALLNGGTHLPWNSPQIIGLLAGGALLLALFIWQEGRAPDPMLPLSLFKNPAIGFSLLATFMVGGLMYGMTVYLPIWAQGVQGFTAFKSGMSLLGISIGWPLSAFLGGKLIMRMGVRPAALLGLTFNVVAASSLVLLGRTLEHLPSPILLALTFMVGCGMGFSTLAFILGVQNSVTWQQRGVATAALQFLRTLGGLVWVSSMGAVMNMTLFSRLREIPGVAAATVSEAGDIANKLLDPQEWGALPVEQLGALRLALADALRDVHLVVLACAVVGLAVALLMPNIRFASAPAKPGAKPAAPPLPAKAEG